MYDVMCACDGKDIVAGNRREKQRKKGGNEGASAHGLWCCRVLPKDN